MDDSNLFGISGVLQASATPVLDAVDACDRWWCSRMRMAMVNALVYGGLPLA